MIDPQREDRAMPPRGNKRLGMTPEVVDEICRTLKSAHDALVGIGSAYPIKFDDSEPYGAARQAIEAIDKVGTALTGDRELFHEQRLSPTPPRYRSGGTSGDRERAKRALEAAANMYAKCHGRSSSEASDSVRASDVVTAYLRVMHEDDPMVQAIEQNH